MTQKEAIFLYIEEMDISMLELILSDDVEYGDWNKKTFLKYLEQTFILLRYAGDTKLNHHKGVCESFTCENTGCAGASFVGNYSKLHIDLILVEKKGKVIDIFNCRTLKSNLLDYQTNDLIPLDFDTNEFSFIKINNLVNNYKTYFSLVEEIKQLSNNKVIIKEDYLSWFIKARLFYVSIDFEKKLHNTVYRFLYSNNGIYTNFVELNLCAKYFSEIDEAVQLYKNFKKTNELQLLYWLIKYEDLYNRLYKFSFFLESKKIVNRNTNLKNNDILIDSSGYENAINFYVLFNRYYQKMLKKHNSFSEEEYQKYYEGDEILFENYSSLRFHLNRKGIVK